MQSMFLGVRWATVGVFNTVIGLLIIWSLRHAGLGEYLSNLIAYSFLIPLSFLLHSFFSFRTRISPRNLMFYLFAVCLGYVANILTVYFLVEIGNFGMVSHLFGMVCYSFCTFVLTAIFIANGAPQSKTLLTTENESK